MSRSWGVSLGHRFDLNRINLNFKGGSMTIQFLRYIVSVAEIGSITEAANQLHISQPSLSAALKEAEKEVGFEIFT